MKKWYLGLKKIGGHQAFCSERLPTPKTHGHLYGAVIGSFVTKEGCLWAEAHGMDNPHFQTVADAERLAKTTRKKRS